MMRRPRWACALTLFELVVAVALVAALAGVALPLVLTRSRNLAFDELLIQIERSGAVARSEAQRKSELLRFEARWDPHNSEYVLGTSRLLSDEPESGEDRLAGVVEAVTEGDSEEFGTSLSELSRLEPVLTLGPAIELHRVLSDEVRDMVLGSATDLQRFDRHRSEDRAVMGDPFHLQRRFTLAIFLPDGTLIPGDTFYIISGAERVARIEANSFLGQISVRRVTPEMLEREAELDLLGPGSSVREDPGDSSQVPAGRGMP